MNTSRRTLVIHPWFKHPSKTPSRDPQSCLEEAIGLAHAIDLEVAETAIVALAKVTSSTLLGSGKVQELKGIVADGNIELTIVNHVLSPVQQRNLEKELGC